MSDNISQSGFLDTFSLRERSQGLIEMPMVPTQFLFSSFSLNQVKRYWVHDIITCQAVHTTSVDRVHPPNRGHAHSPSTQRRVAHPPRRFIFRIGFQESSILTDTSNGRHYGDVAYIDVCYAEGLFHITRHTVPNHIYIVSINGDDIDCRMIESVNGNFPFLRLDSQRRENIKSLLRIFYGLQNYWDTQDNGEHSTPIERGLFVKRYVKNIMSHL